MQPIRDARWEGFCRSKGGGQYIFSASVYILAGSSVSPTSTAQDPLEWVARPYVVDHLGE